MEKIKPYKHDVRVCLKKISDKAKREDYGIKFIDFELSSIQRLFLKPERHKTGQPIKIYRESKSGKQVVKKSFVSHNFCPFCGKKF